MTSTIVAVSSAPTTVFASPGRLTPPQNPTAHELRYALTECAMSHLVALEDITGYSRKGVPLTTKNRQVTSTQLRERGAYWAKHVLETPITWMMCFT